MNSQTCIYMNGCIRMKWPFLIILMCCSFTSFSQDLSKHQWSNRLLVILTNDENSSLVKNQLKEIENNRQSIEERRLLTYLVTPDQFKLVLADEKWQAESNFDKYSSGKSYEVLLIGLDGSIKQREAGLFKASKLFSIIDSMPMRRAEMRGN